MIGGCNWRERGAVLLNLNQPHHNTYRALLMQQTARWKIIMQKETEREKAQRDPERVNVCPLIVKPCILSDWLTGSAGAMLESNWVRVCELEERSLNVSHCCRRQTDSEKKNTSVGQCSDITHLHHQPESLLEATSPVHFRWRGDATLLVAMETINIADFHTEQQAGTVKTRGERNVLKYQWLCLMMMRMKWKKNMVDG